MKIALVNPPFANYRWPSIGLTQLRTSVRAALPDVQVDIHHLNLDCVTILGATWYDEISDGFQSWTGLGDWLFRPAAFPDAPGDAGGLPGLAAHITLFYEVKANLGEGHVRQFADAQLRRIQPGMEALSNESLRLLRKGVTAPRNVTLLRNCLAYGVWLDWNLLVAIPGESMAVYEQTLREAPKLVHLEPPAGAFEIRFDRYSPYFKYPEQFGLAIAPYPYYSFLYPEADGDDRWLHRVVYFFGRAESCAVDEPTRERIAAIRNLINAWRSRWCGDKRPVLKCDFSGIRARVIDTREARDPVEHVPNPAELLALGYLREPRAFEQVRTFLQDRGFSGHDTDDAIATIRQRGWLFEEANNAVSLVVGRSNEAPPPLSG